MKYVYLNQQGEEEEFDEPCEKLKQNLIDQGYIFIKHIDRFGNEYPAERGRRARLTQTKAFNNLLNSWPSMTEEQLDLWRSL